MYLKNLIQKDFKFDKRLMDLHFKQGSVHVDEYKNYLKELQDLSHNQELLSPEDESSNLE